MRIPVLVGVLAASVVLAILNNLLNSHGVPWFGSPEVLPKPEGWPSLSVWQGILGGFKVALKGFAAHKTAVNHNSSDYLRARSQHGIMAEVSYSSEKPLARADVERWVVENLKEMRLIKDFSEVKTTKVIDAHYAYPVPTADRSLVVEKCKAWLEDNSIHSVGRFGEWAYINSDEVLHRGLLLGRKLAKAQRLDTSSQVEKPLSLG